MNRGVFQSSSVQQVMGGSPRWWNSSDMRPPSSSSTSSSIFHQYPQASCFLPPMSPWQDNQEFPESWSQLLLGGLVGEEKCSLNPFQAKKMENWEDHLVYSISTPSMASLKQENSEGGCVYSDEIHAAPARSPWSQMLAVSSPRSCVTTSFSSNNNMLDFSSTKAEKRPAQPDHSSECNSPATGATFKKARVQTSSAQSTFKVRKEKLGDRITALHQLVSPFGKTDTASVLLEAIGYIRFLQGQIEALSSPYLRNGSANRKQSAQGGRNFIFSEDPCQQFESSEQLSNDNIIKNKEPNDEEVHEEPKDLRSRGLCLVPISCMLHVGSDNGADYWAPSFGGGFR